jgi:hypothetical protein
METQTLSALVESTDVRFGSKADVGSAPVDVGFTPKADIGGYHFDVR